MARWSEPPRLGWRRRFLRELHPCRDHAHRRRPLGLGTSTLKKEAMRGRRRTGDARRGVVSGSPRAEGAASVRTLVTRPRFYARRRSRVAGLGEGVVRVVAPIAARTRASSVAESGAARVGVANSALEGAAISSRKMARPRRKIPGLKLKGWRPSARMVESQSSRRSSRIDRRRPARRARRDIRRLFNGEPPDRPSACRPAPARPRHGRRARALAFDCDAGDYWSPSHSQMNTDSRARRCGHWGGVEWSRRRVLDRGQVHSNLR